jgi:phosphoribosylglycinamide formyltransferase-1
VSAHRLAVLVSGTGRHLENLTRLCRAGELDAEVALVVSNRPGVRALERAEQAGIRALVLDAERALDDEAFGRTVFAAVEQAGCDTVVLAGFLRKLAIPDNWRRRVLNIHPSLLPAFGGRGFWGDRVHRAVLERGCQFTGCTVHYVDDEYDHGPILLQRCIAVGAEDTVEGLAARVFEEELVALPEALRRHWG